VSVIRNEVRVAVMTMAHIPEVVVIEQASSVQPWTIGMFTDELDHSDTRTYNVALMDGVVVGFAGVLIQVGEAHVTNVAVDPVHRRRGIARALLLHTLRSVISMGATAATLEVRAANVGAQRLYHQFGFSPAGIRPGYYADGEGALIMWAEDISNEGYRRRLDAIAALTETVSS